MPRHRLLLATFILSTSVLATVFGLAFSADQAFAKRGDSTSMSKIWSCYASGQRVIGGPVGTISETVIGHGYTEREAMWDAQTRCSQLSLQFCNVQTCWNR